MFANYVSEKELMPKIYKESMNPNNNKTNNQVKKQTKTINRRKYKWTTDI